MDSNNTQKIFGRTIPLSWAFNCSCFHVLPAPQILQSFVISIAQNSTKNPIKRHIIFRSCLDVSACNSFASWIENSPLNLITHILCNHQDDKKNVDRYSYHPEAKQVFAPPTMHLTIPWRDSSQKRNRKS